MPTAFTGSLGWTGLHPIQLGGPPLVNTFERKLPAAVPPVSGVDSPARPFLAHAYQNDGVTVLGTFAVLNRPVLNPTLANGGGNQVLLSAQSLVSGMIWGQFIWGNQVWGGSSINITQGNVIRLSEVGGDGSFVYGGVVEDLPETISPAGVSHQILVSPFAVELDDTFSQALYTQPVDVAQIVRDAVRLTRHCSCDPTSVPASTGIMAAATGSLDFRNQPVRQVIDTCRSIAGPTWFWHVDELGRVWFQAMGSVAVYTIPLAQYEQRTKSSSIQNRKNQVTVIGGPTGAPVAPTVVNGDSQASIGIRALNPPIQVPGITDGFALLAIASNVLAVLDRVWNRVDLKVLASYGRRIHASQPGGAMVRYWEPAVNPLQESSAGAGYIGPFIAQSLSNDGLYQDVVAGDIPVTSQTDITNMVQSFVNRKVGFEVVHTPHFVDLAQVMTGSLASGTGTVAGAGGVIVPAGLWRLDPNQIALYDAAGVRRVAQGNLPANGISPAGFKFEADDANGVPLFDSFGLISVMSTLGAVYIGTGQDVTSSTPTLITGATTTFSMTRVLTVLIVYGASMSAGITGDGGSDFVDLFIDGVSPTAGVSGTGLELQFPTTASGSVTSMGVFQTSLAAGSHTVDLRCSRNGTNTPRIHQTQLYVFQLGS